MELKICTACGLEKPITTFGFKKAGHRRAKCRQCVVAKTPSTYVLIIQPRTIYIPICSYCNQELPKAGKCPTCKARRLARVPKKLPGTPRERRRKKVFDHYGWSCHYCGESLPIFLTIDHMNNDGAEHRRNNKLSKDICQWLIVNNFPPGFQTTCLNCNWGKHKLGKPELIQQLTSVGRLAISNISPTSENIFSPDTKSRV